MPKTNTTIQTKSGRVLILSTREEDAAITAAAANDPDALPLTEAQWREALPTLRRAVLHPRRHPAKSASAA